MLPEIGSLDQCGEFLQLDESTGAFVTLEKISFVEAVNLHNQLNELCLAEKLKEFISEDQHHLFFQANKVWRLASISEIDQHKKVLKQHMRELKLQTSEVWVSDAFDYLPKIPKFYSCDINLAEPANGSLALNEQKFVALLFCGAVK